MTSPMHHAVERPFYMCQLLHFCQLLSNPSSDLELEYLFGKPMKRRFQRCTACTEISTFHARVEYISVTKYAIETIGLIWGDKRPQNPPLPLEARGPHLIHECLGDPIHHPKRQLDRYTHFHTTTQQRPRWLQWDAQIHLKNCSFPFDDHHPHQMHPSLDRPHSPSQTASGSNQPFCHSTPPWSVVVLHPSWVSALICRGKGGHALWQVTLCGPIWSMSSGSGDRGACLRTAILRLPYS